MNTTHAPHLAHHYDTPEQQFASGKLGMWIFLATEILMFGGLFCAYAVYRHSHPEVFAYANQYLNKWLGAVNTVVLITSSLTMAWAVRCAQINKTRGLVICLGLTLLGGATFMGIKSVEYQQKWKHHLWFGQTNRFFPGSQGSPIAEEHEKGADNSALVRPSAQPARPLPKTPQTLDPNTGTPDEPKVKPNFAGPAGLAHDAPLAAAQPVRFADLQALDQKRVFTFFSIYFIMTGLHGLHVLAGMGLITWLILRARLGTFGAQYFLPVDLVGLYWHLVDLIWIFLFPLLYLIH